MRQILQWLRGANPETTALSLGNSINHTEPLESIEVPLLPSPRFDEDLENPSSLQDVKESQVVHAIATPKEEDAPLSSTTTTDVSLLSSAPAGYSTNAKQIIPARPVFTNIEVKFLRDVGLQLRLSQGSKLRLGLALASSAVVTALSIWREVEVSQRQATIREDFAHARDGGSCGTIPSQPCDYDSSLDPTSFAACTSLIASYCQWNQQGSIAAAGIVFGVVIGGIVGCNAMRSKNDYELTGHDILVLRYMGLSQKADESSDKYKKRLLREIRKPEFITRFLEAEEHIEHEEPILRVLTRALDEKDIKRRGAAGLKEDTRRVTGITQRGLFEPRVARLILNLGVGPRVQEVEAPQEVEVVPQEHDAAAVADPAPAPAPALR